MLRAVGEPTFWERFAEAVRHILPFDDLVVLSYPADRAPYCTFDVLERERHDVLIEDYLAGPYLLDPFFALATQTDHTGAFALYDVSPDKFRSTEYFKAHYSRTGIRDELGLFMRRNRQCDVISLLRTGESGRYSRSEIADVQDRSAEWTAAAQLHLDRAAGPHRTAGPSNQRWTFADALGGEEQRLSPREAEIAELILRGHSSLSIALTLDIVEGTVKIHRKNIYRKLKISSQAELFSYFLSHFLGRGVKS
ncbi:MAG: helix-turn-helix transcriptional regulator [Rhizobiales bacterium]|nr:helix-turn-helix transcriptional regulator [Hyphomicrobiales bacterium]